MINARIINAIPIAVYGIHILEGFPEEESSVRLKSVFKKVLLNGVVSSIIEEMKVVVDENALKVWFVFDGIGDKVVMSFMSLIVCALFDDKYGFKINGMMAAANVHEKESDCMNGELLSFQRRKMVTVLPTSITPTVNPTIRFKN